MSAGGGMYVWSGTWGALKARIIILVFEKWVPDRVPTWVPDRVPIRGPEGARKEK